MKEKIRVGLCASASHLPDYELIKGLIKIAGNNKDFAKACKFVVAGYTEGDVIWEKIRDLFRGIKAEVTFLPPKPVDSYMELYNEVDILLAPLLENEFNFCKCIVGDSLVNTKNGFKYIKNIVENSDKDEVILNNNERITNFFKYEDEKTIKILTQEGYQIEGTPTHRIKVGYEWKALSDLKVGDVIDLYQPKFEQTNYQTVCYPLLLTKSINSDTFIRSREDMLPRIIINEEWGRLLGYMLGDGCFKPSGITISCDERHTDVVEDVTYLLKSIGLNPQPQKKQIDKRCQTSQCKYGHGVDIRATSMHFYKLSKKYGWCGDKGKTFRVPEVILQSPKSVVKQFIRGLFEADGTVSSSDVNFCTKDLVFCQQIQFLLLGFGIKSNIGFTYNKHYRKYYYVLHLRREGSDIYFREIGFVSKRKNDKLEIITKKKPSNSTIKQIWSSPVKEITEGVNTVYDIEVENQHSYIANGFLNHNSSLKLCEASCKGIPVIASSVFEDKEITGYCRVDEPNDWWKWLKYLIKDDKYIEIGNKLSEINRDEQHFDKRIEDLRQVFEKIANSPRNEVKKPDNLELHSIVYKEGQYAEYEKYDNSHIKTIEQKSYLFEYLPIISITDKVDNEGYLGVFSAKFPEKTGLCRDVLYKLWHDVITDDSFDVINLTPTYKDLTNNYLNWSNLVQPGFLPLFGRLCAQLNLKVEQPKNVIFSGMFVAKKSVYKRFVEEVIKPAIEILETTMKEDVWEDSGYKAGLPTEELKEATGLDFYTWHTFLLERLLSVWLDNNPELKVKNML